MRVLVCGDRNWTNKALIKRFLESSGATLVIHGGCRGADKIAGELSRELGLSEIECPANWQEHGKAAGPIRNRQMLSHRPAMVIAFHNDIQKSKGTKDMINAAKAAGIPVRLIGGPVKAWP